MTKHPKKALLALLIPALMCHTAQANTTEVSEPKVELEHETINISAKPKEQVGETIVTRRELNEQMVQNAHDLVRYNTEVDVAEVGRYGNKGFAIRGVDGNRVAMNIDGVALPEVESNEIYSPYGYIYEGRFNPDLEMMGRVRVAVGADSLLSGSGAVGGSVSYITKEPASMVKDGNLGGYAKVGYTSKNEEVLTAVGLAGVYDKAEFLVNYAHRKGHELKNHDMRKYSKERETNVNYDFCGKGELGACSTPQSARYPDSATYERDSVLLKGYYHLSDEHRVGLSGFYQNQDTNSFARSKDTQTGLRMTKDAEKMKGIDLNYRYQPSSHRWLDTLNTQYQYQDVYGLADTWKHTGSNNDFSAREYRPTQTKTHQLTLNTNLLPIDLGKWGEHQLSATGIYRKQDYTSTMVALAKISGSWMTDPNNFPFPDAKKDTVSLILQDSIKFNERLNAQLGIRYDYHQYTPYFQNNLHFGDTQYAQSERDLLNTNLKSPYWQRFKLYRDLNNGVYNQKPSFNKLTYSGAFDYQVIPEKLTMRYKVGTGFLAPTVTQMYSSTRILTVDQVPNTSLKPETSVNQELEFELKYHPMTITASWYHSDYKNFIHTVYWNRLDNRAKSDATGCGSSGSSWANYTCVRSENLDDAQITGVKLGIKLDASELFNLNNRLYLTADYHKSQDEAQITTDHDGVLTINTLASVPASTVLGLDYHFLNDKASLHARAKFTEAKRPEDTKTIAIKRNGGSYTEYVDTYQHVWRGKDTWVFDVFGSYRASDRLTFQAGIYNLTDSKYIPWENLRQFNNLSINSFAIGDGFNRYTAPGRNYALSLTYEF